MKQSIRDKLENLVGRLDELDRILASGEATRDMDQYRKMSREHAELGPVVALYKEWQQTEADLASAQDMMADPEMKELAEEKIDEEPEELHKESAEEKERHGSDTLLGQPIEDTGGGERERDKERGERRRASDKKRD